MIYKLGWLAWAVMLALILTKVFNLDPWMSFAVGLVLGVISQELSRV
ncbi:MAG TPA: hypothetical protein VFK94_06345 [Patescibacteria group bacterium]|nr:hypothetical protein [Patescibacteria group bacterium]